MGKHERLNKLISLLIQLFEFSSHVVVACETAKKISFFKLKTINGRLWKWIIKKFNSSFEEV